MSSLCAHFSLCQQTTTHLQLVKHVQQGFQDAEKRPQCLTQQMLLLTLHGLCTQHLFSTCKLWQMQPLVYTIHNVLLGRWLKKIIQYIVYTVQSRHLKLFRIFVSKRVTTFCQCINRDFFLTENYKTTETSRLKPKGTYFMDLGHMYVLRLLQPGPGNQPYSIPKITDKNVQINTM